MNAEFTVNFGKTRSKKIADEARKVSRETGDKISKGEIVRRAVDEYLARRKQK